MGLQSQNRIPGLLHAQGARHGCSLGGTILFAKAAAVKFQGQICQKQTTALGTGLLV